MCPYFVRYKVIVPWFLGSIDHVVPLVIRLLPVWLGLFIFATQRLLMSLTFFHIRFSILLLFWPRFAQFYSFSHWPNCGKRDTYTVPMTKGVCLYVAIIWPTSLYTVTMTTCGLWLNLINPKIGQSAQCQAVSLHPHTVAGDRSHFQIFPSVLENRTRKVPISTFLPF